MSDFTKVLDDKVKSMEWPVVMPTDFKHLLTTGQNIAIIDVREPDGCCFSSESIDNKHIYNIPFNNIVSEFPKYDFTEYKSMIMICFAGPKGAVAASILRWMGNDNVYFLKGGIEEYTKL